MSDILHQLQDFDNYGLTASDRFHMRKEAYDEISRLRRVNAELAESIKDLLCSAEEPTHRSNAMEALRAATERSEPT